MTSTLDFYKLPINLYSKNFIMESLETYLGTLSPKTISSFQYQRFEMEKRIKVNISQDYQTYNGLTKYNYLRISQYNDNNALSVYYYFIKSAKQISESTIEFVIVMDVLNTFKYSTSIGQNNYNISEKSLITREHKNRIDPNVEISTTSLRRGHGLHPHFILLNKKIILNPNSSLWESDFQNVYTIGANSPSSRITRIKVTTISKNGLYTQTNTGYNSVDFDYTAGDHVLDLTMDGFSIGSNVLETYFVFEFTLISSNSTDLDNIDTMIEEMDFLELISTGRMRFIDRYQEGIESITFKFSEEELLDQDKNK